MPPLAPIAMAAGTAAAGAAAAGTAAAGTVATLGSAAATGAGALATGAGSLLSAAPGAAMAGGKAIGAGLKAAGTAVKGGTAAKGGAAPLMATPPAAGPALPSLVAAPSIPAHATAAVKSGSALATVPTKTQAMLGAAKSGLGKVINNPMVRDHAIGKLTGGGDGQPAPVATAQGQPHAVGRRPMPAPGPMIMSDDDGNERLKSYSDFLNEALNNG